MIPASYFYRDLYVRHWGDPRNQDPEPARDEPRAPKGGRMAGLARLLATVMPLELGRSATARRA